MTLARAKLLNLVGSNISQKKDGSFQRSIRIVVQCKTNKQNPNFASLTLQALEILSAKNMN